MGWEQVAWEVKISATIFSADFFVEIYFFQICGNFKSATNLKIRKVLEKFWNYEARLEVKASLLLW